jgi:hypothetical protein
MQVALEVPPGFVRRADDSRPRCREVSAGVRETFARKPRNLRLLAVSSPLVSTLRLRAVSPVASNSRRARPANRDRVMVAGG